MTNATKVIIYDTEGNVILNDSVTSPFVGLQAGETFWYGSSNNKTWAKVISISYGVDTSAKVFVIEMVVEPTQIKPTKKHSFSKITDLGVVKITQDNSTWVSVDKKICVGATGIDRNGLILNLSFTFTSGADFKVQRKEILNAGEETIIETNSEIVSCVLLGTKHFTTNDYWAADFKIIQKTI